LEIRTPLPENRDPVVHLDRQFWIVTAVLAVLALMTILWWVWAPITSIMPEAVDKAQQIDALFRFLAASGSALFVFICGYVLYFSLAFRRHAGTPDDAVGIQIHDNNKLEMWWTIIPTVFVVIMAIFSLRIWYGIEVAPNNTLVVEAIGHQWYYTFRYPNVNGEISEMHLPLGQAVTLHVTSSDVIHSFWIPAMRLKADMVPGLINTFEFTPTRPGKYEIICTEFCGTLHGEMHSGTSQNPAYVYIDQPAAYAAWYAHTERLQIHASNAIAAPVSKTQLNLSGGDPKAGAKLFAAKCSACHAIGPFDQKIVGPGLRGVLNDPAHPQLVDGDKATPENIAKILENGFKGSLGQMPNQAANGLSNKDIVNLVAYLKTLK
jgi:cytochrome c oxidase subunit 2